MQGSCHLVCSVLNTMSTQFVSNISGPKLSPSGAAGGLSRSNEESEADNTDLETASVTSSHVSELDSIEEGKCT